jgi:hypothetical protein
MFGPGKNDGEIVKKVPAIKNGERTMARKPKKFYTIEMTFDEWVTINQEIQSKAMFLGGLKKLPQAERRLLIHTNEIMFGERLEDAKAVN